MIKSINPQIHDAQRATSRRNKEKTIPRNIIKLHKISDKGKVFKAASGFFLRHILYRGTKIRMSAVLAPETTQGRPWSTEKKNCQPKIPYPEKISFKTENEINTFSDM